MLVINPLDIGLTEEPKPLTASERVQPRKSHDQEQITVMAVDDSISVRQVVANLVHSK